ncbi:hypothetical protein [Proteiniborus sp. MB09-C3]|uniref:hypothetical protein n=1 Tax=Proteiniborus sp. MB09-C3 TaxID=3050072 RepID=UPI002556831F|nr:hypothetical protein [Proteiniborus sp. MB09-C3]WIV11122.1 hypothetical protein QO263_13315 [Proteiniborus sp. MB09-C3]
MNNSRIYISKDEYIKIVQENAWLKIGGIAFQEDPFMEQDYGYELTYCSNAEDLLKKIGRGNCAIRQAFGYGSLVFANQVNGGDEWLAIKKFNNGDIKLFDSIPFENMIREGKAWTGKNIVDVIKDLDKTDIEKELEEAWYMREEQEEVEELEL